MIWKEDLPKSVYNVKHTALNPLPDETRWLSRSSYMHNKKSLPSKCPNNLIVIVAHLHILFFQLSLYIDRKLISITAAYT